MADEENWRKKILGFLHCQYQKYQKLLQPEKNKLKIQSKRVLGHIKYTHWLEDHYEVNQ